MSRGRFLLLPLLASVLILGACQSEGKLKGEVFIVTEGRENIVMGLVDVKAIEAESVEEHLQSRYKRAQREVKTRASEIGASLDSLDDLSVGSSGLLSVDLYTLSMMGSADAGERVLALPKEGEIDLGRGRQITEPTTGTLGSELDYGFYEVDFGGYSGQVKGSNLIRLSDYRNIQESKEIEDRVEKKLSEVERYISQSYYYRDLPQPAVSDETGSDGNYELTVEGGVPYFLVAKASRSLGDEEEQYYWMVKTTVEGGEEKEVNLSNDNLGSVANKGYALSERTLSTVKGIWDSAVGLAKEGGELEWEKLIYRTAFPEDTTDAPIPDDLDVPEEKLLSDR
ncbi:hypothetical protein [Salinibacter ruber]|uniref:hypothetical protein n=1 Tax=Salinibacter ruber TaxID=146919 RepID=UPI0020741D5C|nr:hypothetical protein [Salinibacter ruber]